MSVYGPIRRRSLKGAATVATSRAAPAIVAAALLAGCGLQSQARGGPVSLTITRAFGAQRLASVTLAHPPAGGTALAALRKRFTVTLGPGGSVRAVNGIRAPGVAGRWSLYINGVASGPRVPVHPGDRLWWDLEDSRVRPPAAVGSFPEPFLHGRGGKRYPTVLECAGDVQAACRHVAAVFGRTGVPASSQLLGTGSGQDSLTVVVGTWRDIRNELAAALLERGPATSGVFARFAGGRRPSLELLNGGGLRVATAGPGAGLIAAVAESSTPPTWLITGTDAAGTRAAAQSLSAAALRDHFALAVSGGHYLPVPR